MIKCTCGKPLGECDCEHTTAIRSELLPPEERKELELALESMFFMKHHKRLNIPWLYANRVDGLAKNCIEVLDSFIKAQLAKVDKQVEQARQEGRKEIVEVIDKAGLIEHDDNPLHEIGATLLDCPGCCWYSYKADRGLDK